MKKFLLLFGICSVSSAYAQGGMLIIQNFTTNYDFHGVLYANNNTGGGCYPLVVSKVPDAIIIPAGTAAKYENYKDQYATSGFPVSIWNVYLGAGSAASPRAWNHGSLAPGGVISNNTKWSMAKFQMYHAGTSVPETYFNGDVGESAPPCNTAPNVVTTSWGNASWFTITSGTNVYTYLNIQ
jgi:hypothetical protein